MSGAPVVLALAGPTGSGKSALALAAAEAWAEAKRPPVEIVAVDAFTIYRGMDIGTAKPAPEDRARVPHHMIDVLEPEQDGSVQWFQDAARRAVADVLARGCTPLLVGGSGLYFRAVVDPLRFPPTDPAVRDQVAARYPDAAGAHHALQAADPQAAAAMDPGNHRRAVRALEVIELTGQRFSDFATEWQRYHSVYPGLQVVGVQLPRVQLTAALEARTRRMLADGWLEEAQALRGRKLSATARQALGYGELFAHLAEECSLEQAVERIDVRTRRYAAAQARWFRKDPRVRWRTPSQVVQELIQCGS